MRHNTVGNQIHGRRLDVHQLKTQSTAVEMFESLKWCCFERIWLKNAVKKE